MKKKLFVLAALVLLIAAVFAPASASAESAGEDYRQSPVYSFVKEFCSRYPSRKAGTAEKVPAEDSVQAYLASKLYGITGTVDRQTFTYDNVTFYHNLISVIPSNPVSKQSVIIGAHYDGVGQGANDNASGVAALLFAAEKLAANRNALPCNVTLVLFDGEESGLVGSQYYVSQMTDEDKDNVLVMFNVDSIANGDNLYLWCENKRTDLANHILSNSRDITEKPYAKGTYNLYSTWGYYETVQNSDHASFRLEGIPTALFFSGTYDAVIWDYAESVSPEKQVMNTMGDTFENLDKTNGAVFVDRINAVTDAVADSVLAQGFIEKAQNADKQLVNLNLWYNDLWPRLIAFAAAIGLVVFIALYYRKLQKKAILGTAEVKTNTVFTTPDADDIFTFKD